MVNQNVLDVLIEKETSRHVDVLFQIGLIPSISPLAFVRNELGEIFPSQHSKHSGWLHGFASG